jgi:hypothetical protein
VNIKALKDAEATFLKQYPGGFRHPEMIELGKKHRMEKLETFAKEAFSKRAFEDTDAIIDGAVKLRDMLRTLPKKDRETFAETLRELLHGKEQVGFDILVRELKKKKLAKCSLATAVQSYL